MFQSIVIFTFTWNFSPIINVIIYICFFLCLSNHRLTAFVAKSFKQAEKYITVDDKIISEALKWLAEKQSANGSFPEVGSVSHRDMQGGASRGLALTAYVLSAFLEVEVRFQHLRTYIYVPYLHLFWALQQRIQLTRVSLKGFFFSHQLDHASVLFQIKIIKILKSVFTV